MPTLSAAVNLLLPRPATNRFGLVPMRRPERAAERVLSTHGVTDVAPAIPVHELSFGQRQRFEIVRALFQEPRLLLLDEPTAAADRGWLFGLLAAVVKNGSSILYISHKLDEIRRLCQRCVILRNGRKVLDSEVAAMSDEEIFAFMADRRALGNPCRCSSRLEDQAPRSRRHRRCQLLVGIG